MPLLSFRAVTRGRSRRWGTDDRCFEVVQEAISRHKLVPRSHPVQSCNVAAAIGLAFGSLGHQIVLQPY